jgi:hypothetical protein
MTIYRTAAGRRQADEAQRELDDHLVTALSGRCVGCGETEPCGRRSALTATILSYGRLPRRRPGLTRAGLRRVT